MPPFLLITLAACGNVQQDELPDARSSGDAMTGIDGASDPDAEIRGCRAASAYIAPSMFDQTASHTNPPDIYALAGSLDSGPDAFQLQLFNGYGVFAAGVVAPGTYEIVGDETQFATCGVCALIFAQRTPDMTFEDPDRVYLATSGTVVISTVTPNLSGTVRNLVLDHVTMDMSATSTVVGDCQTTIDLMDFNAAVVENALVAAPQIAPTKRAR